MSFLNAFICEIWVHVVTFFDQGKPQPSTNAQSCHILEFKSTIRGKQKKKSTCPSITLHSIVDVKNIKEWMHMVNIVVFPI